MGYTHYYTMQKVKGIKAETLEKKFQTAIKQCQKIVSTYYKANGGLSGYSAHTAPGKYGGLNFNGARDDAHETFVVREHFSENLSFNFCKTAQKPYDEVVVACLIVLKHYLGNAIEVDSDGTCDDWILGLNLAKRVTKLNLAIPNTIHNGKTIARIGV